MDYKWIQWIIYLLTGNATDSYSSRYSKHAVFRIPFYKSSSPDHPGTNVKVDRDFLFFRNGFYPQHGKRDRDLAGSYTCKEIAHTCSSTTVRFFKHTFVYGFERSSCLSWKADGWHFRISLQLLNLGAKLVLCILKHISKEFFLLTSLLLSFLERSNVS